MGFPVLIPPFIFHIADVIELNNLGTC